MANQTKKQKALVEKLGDNQKLYGVDEAIQLQSEFSKSAFETYVDELAKFGDMALAAAKGAAEPLQARVSAFVHLVKAA